MTTSQEFKSNRPHGLGGTDIAALLGLSPYKTPLQLWAEKVGYPDVPQKEGIHLRYGQHLEPFVASEYERLTGLHTVQPETVLFHPEHGFMFASIDRLVTASQGTPAMVKGVVVADRLLECKTASAFSRDQWGEAGTDSVPAHYLLQCAWYLAITGCDRADLAVLLGNSDLRVYTIRRDLRLEGLMLEQAQRFWHEHVLTMEPPTPTNAADAHFLYPRDEAGKQLEADADILECIERLGRASLEASAAAEEADEIRGQLMARMGSAQEITQGGRVLATWRCAKPARRLDVQALRSAHPDIAEQFTTAGTSARRFVLRGQ